MSDIEEEPKFVIASEAPIDHPSYLIKTYFDDATSSDLILKLSDDVVLHAHRIILCRRSAYFAKLLDGSFRESDSKLDELHGDDSEAMPAMLRFLYGLPYDESISNTYDGKALLQHTQAYVVAEKYGVENLKPLIYNNIYSVRR